MRVLLDLDEVLVDFVGGAAVRHKVDVKQVIAAWGDGWDMRPGLSKVLGLPQTMTTEDFWTPMMASVEFWANLQPLPWADQLLEAVKMMTGDWFIVSSPGPCLSSLAGKYRLVERLWGAETADRLIPTRYKHLLSRSRTVLVDESEANCSAFMVDEHNTPRGGHAILFPRHNNYRRQVPPKQQLLCVLHELWRYHDQCQQDAREERDRWTKYDREQRDESSG